LLIAAFFTLKLSPLARYFLLLRQKKVSKEKATPGRSEIPAQNRASKAAG
jgi:hypothetical protein